MANIHEITRNLIEFQGTVKAALIKADAVKLLVTTGKNVTGTADLIDNLEHLDATQFTGTIWFESGSYAYLDKDGAGYYWNFVQVPEIPKELKK